MTETTPELRELKKHTRLLAQKSTDRAIMMGILTGLMLGTLALATLPQETGLALLLLLPIALSITFYRVARKWFAREAR